MQMHRRAILSWKIMVFVLQSRYIENTARIVERFEKSGWTHRRPSVIIVASHLRGTFWTGSSRFLFPFPFNSSTKNQLSVVVSLILFNMPFQRLFYSSNLRRLPYFLKHMVMMRWKRNYSSNICLRMAFLLFISPSTR